MILRVAPEGTKVTMVHRDGSTREVETRGIMPTTFFITIWWPLCGVYVVDLRTGAMRSDRWSYGDDDDVSFWRLCPDDLAVARVAYDPDHTWPEIEPWPPRRA